MDPCLVMSLTWWQLAAELFKWFWAELQYCSSAAIHCVWFHPIHFIVASPILLWSFRRSYLLEIFNCMPEKVFRMLHHLPPMLLGSASGQFQLNPCFTFAKLFRQAAHRGAPSISRVPVASAMGPCICWSSPWTKKEKAPISNTSVHFYGS